MIITPGISLSTIDAFRGVVDFYYWKGIAVARAWPSPPKHPATPAQVATWDAFRAAMRWIRSNPTSWHALWNQFPLPPEKSAEDVKRTMALRLAHAHTLPRPPDVLSTSIAPGAVPATTRITVQLSPDPLFTPASQMWMAGAVDNAVHGIAWNALPADCPTNPTARPRYQIYWENQRRILDVDWSPTLRFFLIDVEGTLTKAELITIPITQDAIDPPVSAPIPVPYP
jgi:hypothetical protein